MAVNGGGDGVYDNTTKRQERVTVPAELYLRGSEYQRGALRCRDDSLIVEFLCTEVVYWSWGA